MNLALMAAQIVDEPGKQVILDRAIGDHGHRLLGVANSILRDQSEAEDAVQETFLKAWKAWKDLREDDHLGTWLTRICINHCLDRRRRLVRRVLTGDNIFHSRPAPDDPRMTGQTLDLDRALRGLSVRQRAALYLTYHAGYSIDECAQVMGCGAGSVRTHVARGLAGLRKEMKGDGDV
jgi:RNA polymerase sigma-70 factor (ECF subfamily)